MKNKFSIILIGALALLLMAAAAIAVPPTINYQGRLLDSGGAVVNGTVGMTFSIYNTPTGGSALWNETQSVEVYDGIFVVALGSVTPIYLPFDEQYYLGVTVGADAEMSPRAALVTVPYAFRANTADNIPAGSVGGEEIAIPLNVDGDYAGTLIRGFNYGSGSGILGKHMSSGNMGGLGSQGVGVYGYSPSGLAGDFMGNVHVDGMLSASIVNGSAFQAPLNVVGSYDYGAVINGTNYGSGDAVTGWHSSTGNIGALGSQGAGVIGYSPSGLAGDFMGNVHVDGMLSASIVNGSAFQAPLNVVGSYDYGAVINGTNYGSGDAVTGWHSSTGNIGALGSQGAGVIGYSPSGLAGDFMGDVHVDGTLNASIVNGSAFQAPLNVGGTYDYGAVINGTNYGSGDAVTGWHSSTGNIGALGSQMAGVIGYSPSGLAGDFMGDVHVDGTLNASLVNAGSYTTSGLTFDGGGISAGLSSPGVPGISIGFLGGEGNTGGGASPVAGGTVGLKGGYGNNSVGGNVIVEGGDTSTWSPAGSASTAMLSGGSVDGTATGASVVAQGGISSGGGVWDTAGGTLELHGGDGYGTGAGGDVIIMPGAGSTVGSVGIGTTNPTSKLHLAFSGSDGIVIDSTSGNAPSLKLKQSGTPKATFHVNSTDTYLGTEDAGSDFHLISGGGAVRLTVKPDGKVGIGTETPTSALGVNGTVTATAFSGDGSGLTNIAVGDHNHDADYVNVSGDSMTGPLSVSSSSGSKAVTVVNTALSGSGGDFQIQNASNSETAFFAGTNGGGNAVYAYTNGTGRAGMFQVSNASNTNPSLHAETNGTGPALYSKSTGSGYSGIFTGGVGLYVTSSASSGYAVNSYASGTGGAGSFEIGNSSNTNDALYASTVGGGNALRGYTTGLGNAGQFEINNSSNGLPAILGTTNGSGEGVRGLNTGTGAAGHFEIANGSNTAPAIHATTNGTGPAGQFDGNVDINGYIQLDLTSGAPPSADCDEASERGRMKVDSANSLLYVCVDSGWVSK